MAVALLVPLASSARCTTRGAMLVSAMKGGPCGPAITTDGAAFAVLGSTICAQRRSQIANFGQWHSCNAPSRTTLL
ncbi:hypothetical protein PR003_g22836 [Phytophthora rubi]|uniref:Uncharacterized protein n=2 Tax=Phytophthora TaxID=4783 RepID=A0A6A3GVK7_9STRA|nr:hypothetical protein PR001_g30214 [Phytophthora rubi]KAE8986579.1 hypothetical protein PR002_g22317 [Phytophthora rubi]KAE9300064.1 hypothetical protein PR003_g22836 [Phytophthora rubi]